MERILLRASGVKIAETQPSDIYMTVSMRMFSTRPNLNGFAVSEAFIDRVVQHAERYTCLPLCADTGRQKSGDTGRLGHMLNQDTGTFMSEQIGSFFSFAKAADEYGVSLMGEARIPKRSARVCEVQRSLYAAGNLNFSFEIVASEVSERDGVPVIDAAEGNELVGMAVVTVPAYPEARALALVAEQKKEEKDVDEQVKRIAELEARQKLAEEKQRDEEKLTKRQQDELDEKDKALKKKDEDMEEAAAKRKQCEAELSEKAQLSEQQAARIAELEAQVGELTPFKAEAEKLQAEKDATALQEKQRQMKEYAQRQGLDPESAAVAEAIAQANYEALVAEVLKIQQAEPGKPVVAAYAVAELHAGGQYGGLLERA